MQEKKNAFAPGKDHPAPGALPSIFNRFHPLCLLPALFLLFPAGVFCTADALIQKVIDLMLDIARYSGMALIVWGAIKTILAYKDDNTNEITQGIRLAIVGAMLSAAKTVLAAFL